MDMTIMMSADTALRQAPMTAMTYMAQAKEDIDQIFGEGYAKAHPNLVAAYMQTAAADYNNASQAFSLQAIARAGEAIAEAIRDIDK